MLSRSQVILESYSSRQNEASASVDQRNSESPSLLLLSANTETSLQRQIRNHQERTARNPDCIADLGYTLATHRRHLPHRAFIVSQREKSIEVSSLLRIPSGPPSLVFVFSGQGAQWSGMTKELIEGDDAFRCDLNAMNSVLQRLEFPPSWNLIGISPN
jgi:acyl transferase domain-containing protein